MPLNPYVEVVRGFARLPLPPNAEYLGPADILHRSAGEVVNFLNSPSTAPGFPPPILDEKGPVSLTNYSGDQPTVGNSLARWANNLQLRADHLRREAVTLAGEGGWGSDDSELLLTREFLWLPTGALAVYSLLPGGDPPRDREVTADEILLLQDRLAVLVAGMQVLRETADNLLRNHLVNGDLPTAIWGAYFQALAKSGYRFDPARFSAQATYRT